MVFDMIRDLRIAQGTPMASPGIRGATREILGGRPESS